MGFPIEKHQHAIQVATDLFWREGYEGVSVDDVVKASGLNRYALYQNFGGKKGLFLAVLEAYCDNGKRVTMELLADPTLAAFDALQRSLEIRVDDEMFRSGCLMTTTGVELAAKDPEVAEQVQLYVSEIKGLLQAALSRARAEGDLSPEADPAGVAEIVFNILVGSAVQARMGVSRQVLRSNVNTAFSALRYKS